MCVTNNQYQLLLFLLFQWPTIYAFYSPIRVKSCYDVHQYFIALLFPFSFFLIFFLYGWLGSFSWATMVFLIMKEMSYPDWCMFLVRRDQDLITTKRLVP